MRQISEQSVATRASEVTSLSKHRGGDEIQLLSLRPANATQHTPNHAHSGINVNRRRAPRDKVGDTETEGDRFQTQNTPFSINISSNPANV